MFDMSGHSLTVRGPRDADERDRESDLVVEGEDLARVTVMEFKTLRDGELVVTHDPFATTGEEIELLKGFAAMGRQAVEANARAAV